MRTVTAAVVDEVWVVQTGPAFKLFLQWDLAVPFIRERLLAGDHVHLELATVVGVQHAKDTEGHRHR